MGLIWNTIGYLKIFFYHVVLQCEVCCLDAIAQAQFCEYIHQVILHVIILIRGLIGDFKAG
jgi:hypothetical protein